MNPTHHDLRSYRKKTCLTQKDVSDLLGTKDVSQICRHETNPPHTQIEICLLYHLIFGVPMHSFFPMQKDALKKKLIIRIPNIIDEYRCLPKDPGNVAKIAFLSNVLSVLKSQII